MALETRDLAVIPGDALAAIDHADGLVLGFQQRSLLDVQFDKGAELALPDRLRATITDAVERLADADAGGISARQNILGGVVARIGGGRHGGRREARTFLVGPVDDADRGVRFGSRVIEG